MLRLALVVALVLLPMAAAQEPAGPAFEFNLVGVPAGMIKPEIESPGFQAVATVRCDELLAAAEAGAEPKALVLVAFSAQHDAVVTGPTQIEVDGTACLEPGTTHAAAQQEYYITIPRTAPGLHAIPASAVARLVTASAVVPAPPPITVEFQVTPDYYSLNEVKMPSKLKQCQPGDTVAFDVELVNFGNARTRYTFTVGSEPGGKWAIDLPETIVLDRPTTQDGTSQTVTLEVTCTGLNSEGAFQVLVTPAAADDPAKEGNPLSMNLLARSRGVVPIPDLGPILGLLSIGLALLLRRRP